MAMQQGMSDCQPVLLEPIALVEIFAPNEFTSKVLQLISIRRGQILGYEGITDWQGWDQISAYLALSEMQDLIVELRSQTMGVGSFNWQFDHLQEMPNKLAEKVLIKNGNGHSHG